MKALQLVEETQVDQKQNGDKNTHEDGAILQLLTLVHQLLLLMVTTVFN
jgi:hypothetical protein